MTILHFVFGIIFIFELIAIPCIFSGASLTFTGVVWFFLSLFFTWGLIFFKKKRSLKIEKAGAFPFEKGAAKYAALAFCLIFIQLFIVTTLEHRDDDDAFYVGAAVTSAETDTMFVYSPYTGNETGIYHDQNSDYVLSPLPVLWGFISRVTGIQGAVLCHTVLPPILLVLAYYTYALLAGRLFIDKKEKCKYIWMFLCFVSLFYLFGNYSSRMVGTFLLYRLWQGKAILAAILIPAVFYFFTGYLRDGNKSDLAGIYLTMAAGTVVSFSSVIILPALLLLIILTGLITDRDIKKAVALAPAVLPEVILALIYMAVLRGRYGI